jgi:hypothetical protein
MNSIYETNGASEAKLGDDGRLLILYKVRATLEGLYYFAVGTASQYPTTALGN